MAEAYTLKQYTADLRAIAADTHDEGEIISRVEPLALRLAQNKSWLNESHYGTDPEQGFGVHLLHEEEDHSLAVFCLAWQPGRGAPPHDHGTWAVVAGVEGDEHNILYAQTGDRTRDDYAELEVKYENTVGEGELFSMRSGGIHAVVNRTDKVTLSLHTYGRHFNYTGRSQFNLETKERRSFVVNVE